MARSAWEKSFFATAALLIVGVVIAAIYMLISNAASSSNGEEQAALVTRSVTRTAVRATAAPTSTWTPPPAPPAAAPTDRLDCASIRGTDYVSENERIFFQQYCLTEEPLNPPPTRPPPASPPPPPPAFGAIDAINAAVVWITTSAPKAYVTDPGSCTAIQAVGHWVVTCGARLAGCEGSACQRTLSVCVTAEPALVRPSDQC